MQTIKFIKKATKLYKKVFQNTLYLKAHTLEFILDYTIKEATHLRKLVVSNTDNKARTKEMEKLNKYCTRDWITMQQLTLIVSCLTIKNLFIITLLFCLTLRLPQSFWV